MASAKERRISSGIIVIALPIISIAVAITHASLFPPPTTGLLDAECTVTANKHNHIQCFQSVRALSYALAANVLSYWIDEAERSFAACCPNKLYSPYCSARS